MPAAIPIVAALAGAAAGAYVGGVVGAIVGVAVSLGVAYAGNALFPVRSSRAETGPFERTQQIRQPITPHRAIVGRARVSGPLCFYHANPTRRTAFASRVNGGVAATYNPNDLRYLFIPLAGHRIDAVETVLLNDKPITDSEFASRAAASVGLGRADQAADPMLLAETDGKWTADHRARGRAYVAVVLRRDPAVFPSVPNVSAIARGALCYDPRTGETRWTNNAALVVAWYLTQPFGFRASLDEIDIPALIAAANICDERVPLAAGGTEARYTCSGSFDLDEAPDSILQRLLSSMAGVAVPVGGRWYIHAGAWSAPTFTITADMLRGPYTFRANRPLRDLYNGARAVYVRPDAGYQPADAPPLLDASALAQDGGAERFMDLKLDFTVSGYRAQRLMQIALRRNRLGRSLDLRLQWHALAVRCWDVVQLDLPRVPSGTYRVTRWALAADGTGVDVTLEQDEAAAWAWDPARDERPLPAVVGVQGGTGATLDKPVITVTTPTDPVPATIDIAWTASAGATGYRAQWRAPNVSAWTTITPTGTTATVATAGVAAFEVQATTTDGEFSEWAESPVPPPPAAFQAVGSVDGYDVTVTRAAGTARVQLFAGTDPSFAAAIKLAPEPTGGTTAIADASGIAKYVWARSVAADGNVGPAFGPTLLTPGIPGSGDGNTGGGGESGSGNGDGGGGD